MSIRISTRGRYGVRALFDIAYYGEGKPEQIRKIAERQEIPPRYLEQIFQRLKKAGIIKTRRGAKGGYYLGRSPSDITLAEVIQVTDGPLTPVVCREQKRTEHCHRSPYCVIKPIWDEAGQLLQDFFQSLNIEDLCEMARENDGKLNMQL